MAKGNSLKINKIILSSIFIKTEFQLVAFIVFLANALLGAGFTHASAAAPVVVAAPFAAAVALYGRVAMPALRLFVTMFNDAKLL